MLEEVGWRLGVAGALLQTTWRQFCSLKNVAHAEKAILDFRLGCTMCALIERRAITRS